jgi:AcrR family transcriptional regulator
MKHTPSPAKRRILDAALDRFATRGYHESSMRDIASAVGLQPASLYSHFKNKEALLLCLLEEYKADLARLRVPDARLAQIVASYSPETIFVEGFKTIRRGVASPRTEKTLRLLFNERFKNPLVGQFGLAWLKRENLRQLTRTFRAMQARASLKPVDPEFVSLLYNALINNYFQELFVLRSCERDTRALERKTLRHFQQLAQLLAPDSSRPVRAR